MRGRFITLEGTEGGGKSTQLKRLVDRLGDAGHEVVALREPGGTDISEAIRHLLKHSDANRGMTPESELLLICASRAQLVRQVIRPALAAGRVVVCDRFHDSTTAYQGYGRGLNLEQVAAAIELAVGETRPDLTLYLHVPVAVSESRRAFRNQTETAGRDRFEEADRAFFERVEAGFEAILKAEPERVKRVDATGTVEAVHELIWAEVERLLAV